MRTENLESENIWMNIKSSYSLNHWMTKMWSLHLDPHSFKDLHLWALKDTVLEREERWQRFEGKMMAVEQTLLTQQQLKEKCLRWILAQWETELVRQAGVSLVAIVTEPGAPYTRTQTCTSLLLLKMNRNVSPKQILPKWKVQVLLTKFFHRERQQCLVYLILSFHACGVYYMDVVTV